MIYTHFLKSKRFPDRVPFTDEDFITSEPTECLKMFDKIEYPIKMADDKWLEDFTYQFTYCHDTKNKKVDVLDLRYAKDYIRLEGQCDE